MSLETALEIYVNGLKTYNQKTNIYSAKAYDKLDFHIQDSLNIAELIGNETVNVVDLGSGSGLPAVIIAIANPKNRVYAIESKSRKRQFLTWIKGELNLENLIVFEGDIDLFNSKRGAIGHFYTAKAFAKIPKALETFKKISPPYATFIVPINREQEYDVPKKEFGITLHRIKKADCTFYYLLKKKS